MKYVQVVGGPGSGKSTLSMKIAKKHNLDYYELDALHWKENWQESSLEEFTENIEKAMQKSAGGWIFDGSYTGKIGHVIQPKLDTMVYLQIPPFITIPRALKRSFYRIRHKELLWGNNRETYWGSVKLSWWVIKSYRSRVKRIHQLKASEPGFDVLIFRSNEDANDWLNKKMPK